MLSWLNCMSSWSIACQVGQLRVELVKLYINYAKRENQSQLESHPANIFPMLYLFLLDVIHLGCPCILIGLKVSISSFRNLEPPSPRKGRVGTPWATI